MDLIQSYQNQGFLQQRNESGKAIYTLEKPVKIILSNGVLEAVKKRYPKNSEIGGVIWVKPLSQKVLISEDITFFRNVQNDPSKYSPHPDDYRTTLAEIEKSGYLPILFHTHPTQLGLSSYDGKRVRFYLTSSLQDQDSSFYPVSFSGKSLVMPQAIFVADERFTNGIGVALYNGYLFPLSLAKLTSGEIWSIAISVLLLFWVGTKYVRASQFIIASLIFVIGAYEYFRPKYSEVSGNIEIKVI
ncbi:MAG: hypothetical protein ACOVQ4_13995 [Flectobacillus sp.]|uniref:hypothetical protein n=1 Tax=Flectobacillus sp. TaxID=50419 RepID=UPI003B9C9E53